MHTPIQLIALDLDGTLFNRAGQITELTKSAIKEAVKKGVSVVISTGRPYVGLPFEEANELGIRYAITANGAAVYDLAENVCLREDGIPSKRAAELASVILEKHIHMDAFIHGEAYTQYSSLEIIPNTCLPESVKSYILTTRKMVSDLSAYISENNETIQKATLNFELESDGTFLHREETKKLLLSQPDLRVVSGGYSNLEFTRADISKSKGLLFLSNLLSIPIEQIMACGDSENDKDILETAGLAVAMENATDEIKSIANYVTASCNNDGVGRAIQKFL